MFTLTKSQAKAIVKKWNTLAKDRCNVSVKTVAFIFHDQSDYEMEENGETMIEVRGFQSKNGNPCTFTAYANEVTL